MPFEKRTVRSDPKNSVFFREIDLDFGGSVSWKKQPKCSGPLQQSNRSFSHHFSSTFCLADCQPQRARKDTHRRLRIPLPFSDFDRREDANNRMTDSYFLYGLWLFFLDGLLLLEAFSFKSRLPSFCVCDFGGEDDCVCLSTLIVSVAETAGVSS